MDQDEIAEIDRLAREVITIFGGRNSSVAVLAMLAVIDNIAFAFPANDAFKTQTASLLFEQAQRISDSMLLDKATH